MESEMETGVIGFINFVAEGYSPYCLHESTQTFGICRSVSTKFQVQELKDQGFKASLLIVEALTAN